MHDRVTAADAHLEPLPIVRAVKLDRRRAKRRWLVEGLWTENAVGFIGGAPKLGKSWLGLDLALSVATKTPCLGVHQVPEAGPVLVYLAEDHPSEVRLRIDGLCRHRGLDLDKVKIDVITAPTLRLDLDGDRRRLAGAVQDLRPKLLVLDPLVRLHRRNENDAAEVSELLAFLREMQRTYDVAIAVVHHMRKSGSVADGQALRGSGDFHAWTDSALYLRRVRGRLLLHAEHRSAPSPAPFPIELVVGADSETAHLEVQRDTDASNEKANQTPLVERVVAALRGQPRPIKRTALRQQLRVNNQSLGNALNELLESGAIQRTDEGYTEAVPRSPFRPPPTRRGTERRNDHR
ncbi:MAG TPA: AAA family ATPase [Polyangiaceae bacterium]|nr:AAA family ATPase [Polyangiaceae bacterium]